MYTMVFFFLGYSLTSHTLSVCYQAICIYEADLAERLR